MEEHGTEVGLGLGAFVCTLIGYFKIRNNKEDPMGQIAQRLSDVEKGHLALSKRVETIEDRLDKHFDAIREDIKGTRTEVGEVRDYLFRILNKD